MMNQIKTKFLQNKWIQKGKTWWSRASLDRVKTWLLLTGLLLVCFLYFSLLDWQRYITSFYSTPFYVFLIVRSIEFILPAILCLAIALVLFFKEEFTSQEKIIEEKKGKIYEEDFD
ncbi:MAG: hypothetical protein HDR44_03950 [Allobaculum sp.]|nr:hypothetical protein [Allobaculum sp.]